MLSCEGNENGEKTTTIGQIRKKATLHVQHTFFVHFAPINVNPVRGEYGQGVGI